MRILLVDVYGNEKIKKVKNVFGIYFVLYIILYYHERLKDSHKHEEKRLQSLNRKIVNLAMFTLPKLIGNNANIIG